MWERDTGITAREKRQMLDRGKSAILTKKEKRSRKKDENYQEKRCDKGYKKGRQDRVKTKEEKD